MSTPAGPFGPDGPEAPSPVASGPPAPLPYPPWTATLPISSKLRASMNRTLRMHWAERHYVVQSLQSEAWAAANTKGKRAPRYKVPVTVEFRPFVDRGPLPDTDALGFVAKSVLDGLVNAGVLPDDSPEWVSAVIFYRPELLTQQSLLWIRLAPEGAENDTR